MHAPVAGTLAPYFSLCAAQDIAISLRNLFCVVTLVSLVCGGNIKTPYKATAPWEGPGIREVHQPAVSPMSYSMQLFELH